MIALIDYGAGNLTSVRKALSALGAEYLTTRHVDDLDRVDAVIVPGVGHFDATRALDAGWRHAIRIAVERGAHLFGICLGMQWLFEGSEEAPGLAGFAAFRGFCVRLGNAGTQNPLIHPTPFREGTQNRGIHPTPFPALKVPHVGWNSLDVPGASRLMASIETGAQVYFTHSYVVPVTPVAAAVTTYGQAFAAAVERGRIAGVQFHPEKSGDVGLRILRNWLASI